MDTVTEVPRDEQQPFFAPFEWVSKDKQHGPYDLLSNTRDIADGVATVLEMLEQDQLLLGDEQQRLFNDNIAARLMRLSIASLAVLRDRVDEHFEKLEKT